MDRDSFLFIVLVAAAMALALGERLYAARNERRLLRHGGREIAPWIFRMMVPIYAGIFIASVAEHLSFGRTPPVILAGAMLILFLASKGLKAWAVVQLRDQWTMKVVLPSTLRVVTTGPYRWIRHPNYLAVMGEILALPLAGGAWLTALTGGLLFAMILFFRIRTEEEALMAHPDYVRAMGPRHRFLPGTDR